MLVATAGECGIDPKVVPMFAGACHDHVHQDKIESQMGSKCQNEGYRLAQAMNSGATELSFRDEANMS